MTRDVQGVITIVVSNNELRLALVNDVDENVDVLIAADNPRWSVIMDLLGDRLKAGPIVCKGKTEVDLLIKSISKTKPSSATPDAAVYPSEDRRMLDQLRSDTLAAIAADEANPLSRIKSVPFHHELNQPAGRYVPSGKSSKHNRRHMYGKKR